jgi:hypothetical protein
MHGTMNVKITWNYIYSDCTAQATLSTSVIKKGQIYALYRNNGCYKTHKRAVWVGRRTREYQTRRYTKGVLNGPADSRRRSLQNVMRFLSIS